MIIRNLTRTGIILALGTKRLYLEPTRTSAIVRWTQKMIFRLSNLDFWIFEEACAFPRKNEL